MLIPIPRLLIPDPGAVIPDPTPFFVVDPWSHIPCYEPVFENVGTEFSSLEILQEPEAREDKLK